MNRHDQLLSSIKPTVLTWSERLCGQTTGTAFPQDPTPGLRCFRVDQGINYFYDADNTHWLSTQHYPVIITGVRLTQPFTAGAY
jgi:hypothetical protein